MAPKKWKILDDELHCGKKRAVAALTQFYDDGESQLFLAREFLMRECHPDDILHILSDGDDGDDGDPSAKRKRDDDPIPSTLHPPAKRTRPPPGTKHCAHCFSTEHVSANTYCSKTSHYAMCLAAATFCPDCHDKIEEGPSSLTPVGSALDVYCPMCKRQTCHICNMGDKWITLEDEVVCEDCYFESTGRE